MKSSHHFAPGVIEGGKPARRKSTGVLAVCLVIALACATVAWPLLEGLLR